MSSKTSKDLLIFELFRNKDITYSTIDSLLKYGFDSNETLLSLDFDLDFPQMPDICLSQKCLLRQLLVNFRKNYYQTDDWTQEKDSISHQTVGDTNDDNSLKNYDCNNPNEIFFESESIVRSLKERLLQQNQSLFKPLFELSIDPIVDQLRESLIRVEKQKQEKDLILQKQRIEIRIKDMEIQSLQNQCKQLENQLICEKLKVEKLDYKLKTQNIIREQNKSLIINRFEDKTEKTNINNNCIKSLDDFKAVYYNSGSDNVCNNESDYEQHSSEDHEDHSPDRDRSIKLKANFVNYWTEVETNSSKSVVNKNLDQLKTSLFTDFVAKHSSVGNSPQMSTNEDSIVCIELDTSSNDESQSERVLSPNLKIFDVKTSFNDIQRKNRYSVDEEDDEDLSEMERSADISSDFCGEVESIVCEPDIDCDSNELKTKYKKRTELSVGNDRFVLNNSQQLARNLRPKVQSRAQTQQISQPSNKGQPPSQPTSGWKQFQCDYSDCQYSFVSSEGLKRHVRSVHTKEKPFKCHFNDCQKCFGRSDALKEHLKRHLGLKLFKCSYSDCDFESVSSNSLKRHILSIHLKEKHFKCLYENCEKTFGRKDSLKKHMEKQHQIYDT